MQYTIIILCSLVALVIVIHFIDKKYIENRLELLSDYHEKRFDIQRNYSREMFENTDRYIEMRYDLLLSRIHQLLDENASLRGRISKIERLSKKKNKK